MTYFHCPDCGEIFPEEQARTLLREDGYGSKQILACPSCRNTELDEADECVICGEPIPPDRVSVCTECAETLHKEWVNFVEKVMDRRLKENNGLSADYLDCEQAALDFLDEVGII